MAMSSTPAGPPPTRQYFQLMINPFGHTPRFWKCVRRHFFPPCLETNRWTDNPHAVQNILRCIFLSGVPPHKHLRFLQPDSFSPAGTALCLKFHLLSTQLADLSSPVMKTVFTEESYIPSCALVSPVSFLVNENSLNAKFGRLSPPFCNQERFCPSFPKFQ